MRAVLKKLVERIKAADDLHAVFTVKDSPEMAAAVLRLESKSDENDSVVLIALKAALVAMTNQHHNMPRIGMERECGLVCGAIKQLELKQFMEREGLGPEDMRDDVGCGGLPR